MQNQRIAIIGGGPGGLMTAYRLEQRITTPCEIMLYEASNRLGGKVVTNRFQSAPVNYEAGAAELYDYTQLGPDPLRELVSELGLTTREMRGGTVVLDGNILRNLDDVGRVYGDAPRRELKRLISRARSAISPSEYYESDWREDNKDPLARQTFRDYLAQVKDPIARRYVEVAVHSDLATEPHKTSAMYGLQNYLMDETDYMRLYTIDGGIERLTQELAARIAADVRLETPVTRVELLPQHELPRHEPASGRDDGRRVRVQWSCALPNSWIPAIDWRGGSLPKAMDAHHAFYDYPAHYLRVSILFKKPFWRERISGSFFMLDAFGGCCVYDESSRLDGCDYGVLGWLVGGEAAALLSNQIDAALIGRMLDSLPACLGGARDLFLEGHVTRWINSVSGLPAGFPMRDPEARQFPDVEGNPDLYVVGDYLFDSTLNGVLDSSDTVVDELVDELATEAVAAPTAVGLCRSNRNWPETTSARKGRSQRGYLDHGDHQETGDVNPRRNRTPEACSRDPSHPLSSGSGTGAGLLRRHYKHPKPSVAVESELAVNDLTTLNEPDRLVFVQLTDATSEETRQAVQRWWTAGVAADPAIETTVIELGDIHVRWRPGRLVVESEQPISTDLADALIDLAYHEGTLRDLERSLEKYESNAVADIPYSYRISTKHEAHWKKLGETIESLYTLRLAFARLEPELDRTNRKLPREDRRLLAKLKAYLNLEDRNVAFSDRLEACEDLYEGATDRINDFKAYRSGHNLETWIVTLLVIEVVVLLGDLWLQYRFLID